MPRPDAKPRHHQVAAPKRTMRLLAGIALLAWAAVAPAQSRRHELDPVHTRVMFAVSHAGFSSALGTVSGSTGELWFDPGDWSSARLVAYVPMARIDLGDPKWNKAALARNLLDADDHPQAIFTSTRIEPIDATHAKVHGDLQLHGVTRPVVLDVTLNADKRHPMPPFRRTLGFSATTTISRKDFDIDAWPSVIGDRVELRIEAEATRTRGAEDAPAATVDAPDASAASTIAPDAGSPPEPDTAPEPTP